MVRLHDRPGGSPRNLRYLREHRFPTHNLGAKWREGSSSGWRLAPKVCQALWERCRLSSHGHTVEGGHHVHLKRRQARGVSNCYFQLLSRRAGSQVHPPTSQPAGPRTQHRVPQAGLCPGLDCTGQRDCVFTCHYGSGLKCTVPCAGKQQEVWGHCPFCSPSSVSPRGTRGRTHFLSMSQDCMCTGPVS